MPLSAGGMEIETVIVKSEPWEVEDESPPRPVRPRARFAAKRKHLHTIRGADTHFSNMEKKRSDNWTWQDKMLLKNLVMQRVDIIENKVTDTETNERKVAAWTALQTNFNVMRNGPPRTVSQLKNQWGSQKSAERRKANIRKLREKAGATPGSDYSISRLQEDEFDSDCNQAPAEDPESKLDVGPDGAPVRAAPALTIEVSPLVRTQTHQVRRAAPTADLATVELRCREQLHGLQVENERRRLRNLQLEERLLLAKIKYFEKKTKELA